MSAVTSDADGGRPARRLLLLGYPAQLGAWQREHMDGLERELALVMLAAEDGATSAPGRLLSLAAHVRTTYAAELDEPTRQREEAAARGDLRVDISYPAVPGASEIVRAWGDALDAVDRYCEAGDLLSLATPPLLVQLRRWVLGELLAQLDGAEPTPWVGPAERPRAGSDALVR